MKIITMYLPQFHRVKENDEWWGEGFTEWTTVRNAVKMYEGQYQPHVPLKENYYNLLDKNTMQWQVELMKKYSVDAQCFYHYWFKEGRQILEKPAENLLQWQDVDMPFCLCWANETWARSWSKLMNVNDWASIYEKKEDKKGTGILIEQDYGDEEEWKKHFDYLLPFFKDKRYIRKDNRPVFVIYKSLLIPCLSEMLTKWNEWAIENGLEGLYVIGANADYKAQKSLNCVLFHEPQYSIGRVSKKRDKHTAPRRLEYDDVWLESLLHRSSNKNDIYGGFVGYDDTPRSGNKGIAIDNSTPEKFKHYLTELIAKNMANNNELVFINAWNEWGESMHLEPDERYQYSFLEAVPYAKEHYKEYIVKYTRTEEDIIFCLQREKEEWADRCLRYEEYWKILDAWLGLKENNFLVEQYIEENNFETIAIYGMGMLGKHLLNELKNGKTKVEYAIDRNADKIDVGLKMYFPDDNFPQTDVIVVTATYAFSEIKAQLIARGYKNIVSLKELIKTVIESKKV